MMTCRLMNCPHIGTCHLEENGATDLCPVLAVIKAEAIAKTEAAWASKFPVHEVLPLEHYQGTWGTAAEGFTLDLGLGRIVALHLAREKATLEKIAYEKEHKIILIDPKPRPEWGRQARARKLRMEEQRSGMDFHEMPTLTNDYSAYPPLTHVEDLEAKELKHKDETTKKQKQYWAKVNARGRLQKRQDDRERILMQLLDDMKDEK